jgi:hypothetical protein
LAENSSRGKGHGILAENGCLPKNDGASHFRQNAQKRIERNVAYVDLLTAF